MGNVVGVELLLAYAPLLLVVGLWLSAGLLAAVGRPGLRDWLRRRTAVPTESHDGEGQ